MPCVHGVQAGLLPVQKLKPGDPMFGSALDRAEPLVTFALSCGSASSPPVRSHPEPPEVRDLTAVWTYSRIMPSVSCYPTSMPLQAAPVAFTSMPQLRVKL